MIHLSELQRSESTSIIRNISTFLNESEITKTGLFNGSSGISLFHFYYNQCFSDDLLSFEEGLSLLSHETSVFNSYGEAHSRANDFQWLLWVIIHLNENDFFSIERDDYADAKEFLLTRYETLLKQGNYDLLYGHVGMNLVLKKFIDKDLFLKLNETFFNSTAIKDTNGTKWLFNIFSPSSKGFNFGLAHGMPSIIISLLDLFELSDSENRNFADLALDCVKYMLSKEQDPLIILSYFPNNIDETTSLPSFSRLAWCYGDLGVGFAIWKCGKVLKNDEFLRKGIEILTHCALRKDRESTLIKDLGICHGSSGLALFFKRLYEYTELQVFSEAATYWLNYTTKAVNNYGDIGEIKVWKEKPEECVFEEGFLTGVAGIGLVLLDFISPQKLTWSECILL